jgi:hypothetical protein
MKVIKYIMSIPKFTAESSLLQSNETFSHIEQFRIVDLGVIPQDSGPVGDCLCCIGSNSYDCCARCVDWILS